MTILLDECVPRAMKYALGALGYHCLTVQEQGWSGKLNGELLKLAEPEFDVLVTLDTNLQYQQSLAGRKIAILVLRARTNRLEDLSLLFQPCIKALQEIKSGEIVYVGPAV